MALAALGLVALTIAVRLYRALLPATAGAAGGCGFQLVCAAAAAGLLGGAVWAWRREAD